MSSSQKPKILALRDFREKASPTAHAVQPCGGFFLTRSNGGYTEEFPYISSGDLAVLSAIEEAAHRQGSIDRNLRSGGGVLVKFPRPTK